MTILEHIERIIGFVGDGGLNENFFAEKTEHLDAISCFLKTSHIQTVLFALLCDNFGEGPMPVSKLAAVLKCRKMSMLKFMDDFEVLEKKRLIKAQKKSFEKEFPCYSVPFAVLDAVRKGIEYQDKKYEQLSPMDFFDAAGNLFAAREEDELDRRSLLDELNYLFGQNKDIAFVKNINTFNLNENSILIMLMFCCVLLHDDRETLQMRDMQGVLNRGEAILVHHRFKLGEHNLFTEGLVEFDCQMGMADTELYRLTEKAKNQFLADVDLTKRKVKNLIQWESIGEKKLYYSEKIEQRIKELTNLLKEDNFLNIQTRLSENNMRTGFPCIFSGPPGTGKTETVYQIARITGRDIMRVDIAETKSMWFGESEKRIKEVFARYKGAVKSGGPAPILLFNEADAVLGKRRELSKTRSGPEQTENAIQNIILQEMEELNGILFATTNLTVNLDKAFDRRFLYKIEFEKPDTFSKRLMWQSLIPSLPEEDAGFLANKYSFSGGQIENIARKSTVSFVLNGKAPCFEKLKMFCEEESLETPASAIGFCAG